MKELLTIVAGIALTAVAAMGLSFFISCLWERERRASLVAGLQMAGMLFVLFLFLFLTRAGCFETSLGAALLTLGLAVAAVALFLLLRRGAPNMKALGGTKGYLAGEVNRVDEREIVFARNRSIRPGSSEYDLFYKEHAEIEADDAKRRERGGPLGPLGSIDRPCEGPNVSATLACLSIPLHLSTQKQVKPSPHPFVKDQRIPLTPEEAAQKVKAFALHLGADLVGIAEINPLWVYSRRGEIFRDNWEDWGKEIPVEHRYAVVFATEMDFRLVGAAPHTPTVIESMRNYARGAYLSVQLASYIANLGYPATANHLRHYEALLVPLAVDAGLGEVGRLGYLMTKEFGPRVRLGAVTTNLPLVPDKPVDLGVEDFCNICQKCALSCPSQSIPAGEQTEANGILRWKLNAETCFEYWGKIGTDCNVCMRVCPWAHARTLPHKLIVALVSRNPWARRLFSVMDDWFYGRKPKPRIPPAWARLSS